MVQRATAVDQSRTTPTDVLAGVWSTKSRGYRPAGNRACWTQRGGRYGPAASQSDAAFIAMLAGTVNGEEILTHRGN